MEKLILSCGRYIPLTAGTSEARVRAMEAYLARLSEDLEMLLGEMDKTPAGMQTVDRRLVAMNEEREGGA